MIAFIELILLSPIFLACLLLFAIIADHNNIRVLVSFLTICLFVGLYLLCDLTVKETGIIAATYIPCGLLWSFWKFRSFAKKHVTEYNSLFSIDALREQLRASFEKESLLRKISPNYNVGKITYWVACWPISILESILSKVIDFIESLVTIVFKNTYNAIYNSVIKDIK